MRYSKVYSTAILTGVAAVTVGGIINWWLNSSVSLRSKDNYNSTCSIIIFLEYHADKGGAQAILDTLNGLVDRGYKHYLFEEPSDSTYENMYDDVSNSKTQRLDAQVTHLHSQIVAHGTKISKKEVKEYIEQYPKVQDELKAVSRAYIDLKESYESTLRLLKALKNKGLGIHAVDIPAEDKVAYLISIENAETDTTDNAHRDQFMSQKAESICLAGGVKQVLLVGAYHHNIGAILKDKGFNVKLFAVFSAYKIQESDLDPNLPEAVRASQINSMRTVDTIQQLDDLVFIDLYNNPELKGGYVSTILNAVDSI